MLRDILLVLVVFAALPVGAQEAAGDTSAVYETKHYAVLELPQKLWSVLVYPLGQFTIYAEDTELPKRMRNWFTNEDHTFGLFPYVQLGGETGSGMGASTYHTNLFGRGKEFNAVYAFAAAERQTGSALYYDPNVSGGPLYFSAEAAYLKTDNRKATINGAVLRDTSSLFTIERIDALATLGWRPNADELEDYRNNIYIEGRVGLGVRDFGGVFGPAALGGTSSAELFPGLGEEISLFSVGGRIAYDDRDYKEPRREISHPLNYVFPGRVLLLANDFYYSFRDITYPERGGLLQAEVDFVTGSEEARFLRLGLEAQRFFTLFFRNRILGLRARLDKAHALGDDGIVPYPDQAILGGSQRLRGYKRGVFRGEGALLLSAEYRYPIWDTWNAYLFWDEGQIFDKYDQIEVGRFRTSFGGGVSLRTEQAFLIGFRIGHSKEQKALVGFSLEQEF